MIALLGSLAGSLIFMLLSHMIDFCFHFFSCVSQLIALLDGLAASFWYRFAFIFSSVSDVTALLGAVAGVFSIGLAHMSFHFPR